MLMRSKLSISITAKKPTTTTTNPNKIYGKERKKKTKKKSVTVSNKQQVANSPENQLLFIVRKIRFFSVRTQHINCFQ